MRGPGPWLMRHWWGSISTAPTYFQAGFRVWGAQRLGGYGPVDIAMILYRFRRYSKTSFILFFFPGFRSRGDIFSRVAAAELNIYTRIKQQKKNWSASVFVINIIRISSAVQRPMNFIPIVIRGTRPRRRMSWIGHDLVRYSDNKNA